MCGIASIINPTLNGVSEIETMLKRIEHRGDSPPVYEELSNSILGCVRLEIVDIPNGKQPFFNEDKTIGVVFNGEIYNYKTLQSELKSKGHKFISDCDTEVLIHLYQEYGKDFILKLEGMFAFLIYDSIENDFFGVRDFYGVKPFFYCKKDNTTYISSEMKSFLDLDVDEFKELKPGEYITKEGVFQYYSNNEKTNWNNDSVETVSMKLRELLDEAVRKRVQTDLPIAVFLSGGIDSSIVQLLAYKYHDDVTALVIGDESGEDVIFAKRLCNDLNLKFKHIEIDKNELLKHIPEIIYSIETFEPNPIRGSILSMKLSEIAHNLGFKVVLCGEGSDEILAGYGDFLFINDEKDIHNKIINLLDDLYRTQLLRIDKTGMNHAVEVREPFLDSALVEYVLSIHPKMKVATNNSGEKTTKFILREAFKDLLPEYIYSREKMTLMEGAGIGSVEKGTGILFSYASNQISDDEFQSISDNFSEYKLKDKEEAYCFKIFNQFYSKARFAIERVDCAQKEITKKSGNQVNKHNQIIYHAKGEY